MDMVSQTKENSVITKYGNPAAKLVPFQNEEKPILFGYLKGTVTEQGDVISAIDEAWEADA